MKNLQKPSVARRTAILGGACAALCVVLLGGLSVAQSERAVTEPDPVGAPPSVRRLTEAEYRATVADIFGPDISIVGRFERPLREEGLIAVGTSHSTISPFAIEQYDASARGIAAAVVSEERREELVPCAPRSPTRFDRNCAREFVDHYGPLIFRREMTRSERDHYVQVVRDAQQRLDNDFYAGLELSLAGMMMTPDFLLRIERTEADPANRGQYRLDGYSKASRLSFLLTGAAPDAELLRAAGAGELHTADGLNRQVERLIESPNYERAVRAFFRDMMEFELFDELAKDPVIYPAFNSSVSEDAQEQTLRTIIDTTVTRNEDYRQIFTTRRTHLTRALGAIYRMPVATRNGWEAAEYSQSSGRAGILTDISFVALHSHPGRSSPTLRGVAIREVFLCQIVPDPPANVDFSVVQDTTNSSMPTARERLTAHQNQPACASCHRLMDPLGLTLENFDGVGAFRQRENDAMIDASGSLDGREFETPDQLGQAIHDHPQTSRCLVDKMYRSAVGRATTREERPWMDYLNQSFQANGYRLPDLMRTIATSRTFYAISAAADEETSDQAALQLQRNGERS